MKKLLILLVLLLMPTTGSASDLYPWSWPDTLGQLGVTAVTALDWGQTRYISAHPTICFEANPVLGVHPSMQKVDIYFPAVILLELGVSYAAPELVLLLGGSAALAEQARTGAQGIFIGMEGAVVGSNLRYGVKFNY